MNIPKRIRKQFPILKQKTGDYPLVFLNNASTTQKPDMVIDAVSNYYRTSNSNINRAAHHLAAQSEYIVDKVRKKAAKWIHAAGQDEIIFTSGTTAGINLVAHAYGKHHIKKGDEIIVSSMEHSSNWLPWYDLAKRKGVIFKVIPTTGEGELDQKAYAELLTSRTKFVALTYVSNVLGTINPIKKMVEQAKKKGAVVLVDAAQAMAHFPIDVQDIDCDFLAFSAHKMYGPTGIGVLYAKRIHLDAMSPWQLGGGILRTMQPNRTVYEPVPHRFEAGTLHIAGIAGLGAAFTFLEHVSYPVIQAYEGELYAYMLEKLQRLPDLKLWGWHDTSDRVPIVSFTMGDIHPLDIAIKLDSIGIAVRTGKHCASKLLDQLGVEGTVRISLGIYNTKEDIDRLLDGLEQIRDIL